MPKRDTVLHIITTLGTGGAEWALYNLLSGGLAARFDSHVLTLGDAATMGPKISELGVPVTALDIRGAGSLPAALRSLRRNAINTRPALIQGWMYHGNVAAVAARAFSQGRPVLSWNIRHSLYDIADEKRTTRLMIRANRRLSRSADAILYNSQLAREQHEDFGFTAGRGRVVRNGIDLQKFRASAASRETLRKELAIPADALVVGHVGRYHPMKDHACFLRAAALLMEKQSNTHFVLAGRGVSLKESALRDLIPEAANDRFHLLGDRGDVPRIMSAMDLLCQSSWAEAFPNVLGEAMAIGIPCVATDVGDSAAIVGDTGVLVPPRDAHALAEGVAHLLTMSRAERDALGASARARIEHRYSLDTVVGRYAALYEQLLSTKRVA